MSSQVLKQEARGLDTSSNLSHHIRTLSAARRRSIVQLTNSCLRAALFILPTTHWKEDAAP